MEKVTRIISDIRQNKLDAENPIQPVNKSFCVKLASTKQRTQK